MKNDRPIQPLAIGLVILGIGLGLWIGWNWREHRSAGESAGRCFLHYRISDGSLRIQTPGGVVRTFEGVISGDNQAESIALRNRGPIPPGIYLVLTRDQGNPTYHGQQAFLLDPLDGQAGNDRIDGHPLEAGGGRSAFRIHGGTRTDGCLATEEIETIASLLLPHGSEERFDVYSRPADSGRPNMKRFNETNPGVWESAPEDGEWELFEQEQQIGLLWVTP